MADDKRRNGDEEEFKVTVRDRRRVTVEGDIREVEDAYVAPPAPAPAAEKPAAKPAAEPADQPAAKPRGGGLGGAEEARANRRGPLREVDEDSAAAADESAAPGEAPKISSVYEYVQMLASELSVWSIAALGLMANPMTGLVTTDLAQAEFAVEAAEALLQTLVADEKVPAEQSLGLYQGLVVQFGSVAAQLLRQPAQVLIQELRKVRFCIDTADRFAQQLTALVDADGDSQQKAQMAEIDRFLSELRLAFVQASGGGGIIG